MITGQLTQFAYSEFSAAPLVPITNVLSSIIGGLTRLPIAKVLDIWGRAQGYPLMVFCCTIGMEVTDGPHPLLINSRSYESWLLVIM